MYKYSRVKEDFAVLSNPDLCQRNRDHSTKIAYDVLDGHTYETLDKEISEGFD